jgi:membrane-bound lytic murein transglycosylase D
LLIVPAVIASAFSVPALARQRFLGDEGPGTFAVPSILAPNVKLWTAVYGRYDSSQELYYDTKHLDVILSVLDLRPFMPEPSDSTETRRRKLLRKTDAIEAERRRVQAAVLRVAHGKRTGLSKLERQVYDAYRAAPRGAIHGAHQRIGAHVGLRDRFGEGLKRLARYKPYVVEVLRRHDLPAELVALAMTESLFNPKAKSKSGAYGCWQFLHGTGREYLHINGIVDERRDPIVATDAAARMLKNNLRRLQRWPLALTGYNYGPNGMVRAARETGSYDLVQILRRWKSKRFKFASRNYYASFLAALEVMNNQKRYFPSLRFPAPLRFETLKVPGNTPLQVVVKRCRARLEDLADLNPGLTPEVITSGRALPQGYPLRIPTESTMRCLRTFRKFAASHPMPKPRLRSHRVGPGQTWNGLAHRVGLTLAELLGLNGLQKPRALRVGELLRIPERPRLGFTYVPVTSLRMARAEEPDSDLASP